MPDMNTDGWMGRFDVARYREAAAKARRVFPAGVADLIRQELHAAERFSFLPSETSLIARVVRDIEATPYPKKAA